MAHPFAPQVEKQLAETKYTSNRSTVDRVIALLENGCCKEADFLASAELLFHSNDPELWLLAGMARFQHGNLRTAESAFKMSAWLNDNALAREMLKVIGAVSV